MGTSQMLASFLPESSTRITATNAVTSACKKGNKQQQKTKSIARAHTHRKTNKKSKADQKQRLCGSRRCRAKAFPLELQVNSSAKLEDGHTAA